MGAIFRTHKCGGEYSECVGYRFRYLCGLWGVSLACRVSFSIPIGGLIALPIKSYRLAEQTARRYLLFDVITFDYLAK